MTELPRFAQIQTGFQQRISEPARVRSPEVDYGCWPRGALRDQRDWPHWRVSLIVSTGEVYAVEMQGHKPDRFIVLGHVTLGEPGRAEMETAMQGWAGGETLRGLTDLIGRFR